MRYYCTYFDRHYLLRGLALYRSLKQRAEPFTLWVLCFDNWTFEVLTKLGEPNLRPIALADFECGDTDLLTAKKTRSRVDYYFTCSPSLPLYVLNHFPDVDIITYLDADLFFYASPEPIFEELGDKSILIIGHRFPPRLKDREQFGIYNVGFLSFRHDSAGRDCLEWWRARCLEWCSSQGEDGKYADQKYLDDWPTRFPGVVVLRHPGANLAPWNWMNYPIRVSEDGITVDDQPLIFFHFHGLTLFTSWLCDPVSEGKGYGEMPRGLRWHLYPDYVRQLQAASRWVADRMGVDAPLPRTRIAPGSYHWRKLAGKVLEGHLVLTLGPSQRGE